MDLLKQLAELQLDEDELLVSFDVTALFICMPVDKALDIIFDLLSKDTTLAQCTNMMAPQVWDLLALCLKTTYCQYGEVLYSQIEGAAMGSPVSPIVANLFMEWFEVFALESFMFEVKIW